MLSPTFETAYNIDEGIRRIAALERDSKFKKWRKIALDEMDKSLPEYERPLKMITKREPTCFQKSVAKHGVLKACLMYVCP